MAWNVFSESDILDITNKCIFSPPDELRESLKRKNLFIFTDLLKNLFFNSNWEKKT